MVTPSWSGGKKRTRMADTSTTTPKPPMKPTNPTYYPTPDPSTPGMRRNYDDEEGIDLHDKADMDEMELTTLQQATDNTRKRQSDYGLRMSHGWTIYDGTFDPMPQNKRKKRDVPYPSFVQHAFRARAGLSNLQLSRDAPISMAALDIATGHLFRCIPGLVRRYIYLAPPNGPALWGDDEKAVEIMYGRMEYTDYHRPAFPPTSKGEREYKLFTDLKKRPWIIWPLYVEDEFGKDYVTVMWFCERTSTDPQVFNRVISYAVIDPRRSEDAGNDGRHHLIEERIERIKAQLLRFWEKGGFKTEHVEYKEVLCSPMPLDEATSGERCFANVKDIFNQITNWYERGGKFSRVGTVDSLQKWVNPFQMRVEMTGINAFILMASLDFDARISVEAILPNTMTEVAADGVKKWVRNYDLAGPFEEPQIAADDFLLPPTDVWKIEG